LRSHTAIAVLTLLLVASSQGCGTDKGRDGPPFEPGDISGPRSLLITNSDIEGVGASTPYGTVLRWWQALQLGDVKGVRQSYAARISTKEATREIDSFQPRFSQPIKPEVRTQGKLATVNVNVRTARPFADTTGVIDVRDFLTHFYLAHKAAGWRLRVGSFEHYAMGRRNARLAVR
jgi:hypothetical protein